MARAVKTTDEDKSIIPDFLRADAGIGAEDIDQNDVAVPYLKLMQGLSPEVENGLASIGEFYHVMAEMPLGKEIIVVPVFRRRRYILWRPRWDGGGILSRSDDAINWDVKGEWEVKPNKDSEKKVTWSTLDGTVAKSGLDRWGSSDPTDENSPPAASLTYDFALVIVGQEEISPVVFSVGKTGVKPAKAWQGKIKTMSTRVPLFGQQFALSSFKDNNSKGEQFQNFKATAKGFVQDKEQYEYYKSLHQSFVESGLKVVDPDQDQEEAGQTATSNKF